MSTISTDLLLGIADAVIAADSDGRIVLWNDAAEAIFGYPRERIIGTNVRELLSERIILAYDEAFQATVAAGAPQNSHVVLLARLASGNEIPVEAALSVGRYNEEPIFIGVVRQARRQLRRLALARENERRLREAEQLAGMGSFEWIVGSDEITWSDQLARLYGYDAGEHPKTLTAFLERVHPDDRQAVQNQIGQALQDGAAWAMEERIVRADNGETRILSSEVRAVRNTEGRVVRLCGICHDITESRRAEEALASAEARLRERTLYDPLTSLPNRTLALDRLTGALARATRNRACVAVLLFNLDNFSLINDAVGHVVGDQILRTVALRLVAAARVSDSAARVGGDEFMIVCEGVPPAEIVDAAQRIRHLLSLPMAVGAQELTITSSVGISVGHGSESPEQLIRDADLALNKAKRGGKNAVEVFDEALRHRANDRVSVEADLRRALHDGHIEPYYQPIVDLTDGTIIGFEALARWNHPERGLLLPKHFLSIAEEAHLIGALGETMLRGACRQLAMWQRTKPQLTMAVNLSLRQLDREFIALTEEVLREYAIVPRTLHVEVTETVLLDMQTSAASHLNTLAGLGVQLGIDDFGTGYSSLLYLKRFPVRFIKIDRSFVEGLPGSVEDAAIVSAVVRLATSLELSAIAEGVESEAQYDELRRLGCKVAQGYYISQPQPASAFPDFG